MRHFNLGLLSIIGLAALLSACPDKDPQSEPTPSGDRVLEILADESGELLAAAMEEHVPTDEEMALVALFWFTMADGKVDGFYDDEMIRIGVVDKVAALSAKYPSVFDESFGTSSQGLVRSKDDYECDNPCTPAADLLGKASLMVISKGIETLLESKNTISGAAAWVGYKSTKTGVDLTAATANTVALDLKVEDAITVAEIIGTSLSAGSNLALAAGKTGLAVYNAAAVSTLLSAITFTAGLTYEGVKITTLATECHIWKQDYCNLCGNGVVEAYAGEGCEEPNCPKEDYDCDDLDYCTDDSITGMVSDCSARCVHKKVSNCVDNDFCCPGNCTADNDSDCNATCGDGVAEGGEECDGDDLRTVPGGEVPRSRTCADFPGFDNGTLRCGSDCKLDKSGCTNCGNAVIEGDEFCDVGEFKESISCTNFPQFTGGELSCNSTCTNYDFSRCKGSSTCPNEGEECSVRCGSSDSFGGRCDGWFCDQDSSARCLGVIVCDAQGQPGCALLG